MQTYDFIIIGAGIIGLTIAYRLRQRFPDAAILLLEKEDDVARHASGRNSGVLHAGFYYTANSLKAQLTVAGNRAMKAYCQEKGLAINACGKLVVASSEAELDQLYELEQRGRVNGARVQLVDEAEARAIEPNVRTLQQALYSPDTATVDPIAVCQSLKQDLIKGQVDFSFETRYLGHREQTLLTNQGKFTAGRIINCAGLYADRIAQDFGFGQDFTIIPFKGLYLGYARDSSCIRTHIYPVPNLKYPFLGVHFTKTVQGAVKIGPTAIPAFWRENYQGLEGFQLQEFIEIMFHEARLFLSNAFGFRTLAFEEIKKYNPRHLIGLARKMVREIDPEGFGTFLKPGIRAQLLNRRTLELVQDFLIEGDDHSIHVLNAVSPAFTCAFAFADLVLERYIP